MVRKAAKVPAVEARRLERIRELAREHRRAGRALERAIRAAHERGISFAKIGRAAGIPAMSAWRIVRPSNGQASDQTEPVHPAKPATKPKRGGK